MIPSSVTHLFFDAGNTLVHVNMEVVSRTLARHGIRLSPAELWRGEHRARRAVDTPEVVGTTDDAARWRIYFEAILRECGIHRPEDVEPVLRDLHDYHRRANLWEVVPPEVPGVLRALRGRLRLGVVSNSNGTVREKLRRTGLAGFFDLIVDSHEEGVEKPDPRLFRVALERAGAVPARSAHVGDLYHVDVVGARAAGLEAILLDPGDVHADKPVRRIRSLRELVEGMDSPGPAPL